MKLLPHKTGDEFQTDETRGALLAVIVVMIVLAAGIVLIVQGLT
jgi:hypothetical protein